MTKIFWVTIAALVVGVFAAQVQRTVFTPAIPADVIPADELVLPPFGEDTTDLGLISDFLTKMPEGPSPCDVMVAIADLEQRMSGTTLKVGTKEYRYSEIRNGSTFTFKDVEKQIALGLLNPLTCETRTTVIVKRGDELIAHESVTIEPRRRANGIRWNNWATEYTVTHPEGYTVVAVLYPYIQNSGRSRTITPVFYTPYSAILHTPEGVQQGLWYLAGLVASASEELRRLQVPSQAFPGTLVSDHPLYQEIAMRLDANEHMDPGEFLLDPRFTADRIHSIIGANRERTARFTCSSANACGISQFTEPTYKQMRRNYPQAELNPDSMEGRRDHLNVTMAQLLLMDSNMASIIRAFGPDVAQDPWVTDGLIAAYNTGVGRTIKVRAIAERTGVTDWMEASGRCSKANRHAECFLDETKWYMVKERYLRDEWNRPEGMIRSTSFEYSAVVGL